jgi:hypothetical protein
MKLICHIVVVDYLIIESVFVKAIMQLPNQWISGINEGCPDGHSFPLQPSHWFDLWGQATEGGIKACWNPVQGNGSRNISNRES